MGKRWIFLISAILTLIIGFFVAIAAAPYGIMGIAMNRMLQTGASVNVWSFAPRPDDENQRVVRSSPDLLYAICVYDLSDGPLLVSQEASASPNYRSISVFEASTVNIAAFNDQTHPDGIRFVLARHGQAVKTDLMVVRSSSKRGMVLDRRLIPTEAAMQAADAARRENLCQPFQGEE